MEWTDEGIVLGVRRHGESSAIVELLTRDHGRHLGLVRGGSGSRMRPMLQPGNTVSAVWRARLDEHLGMYALESMRSRAANLLASSHGVYGVTYVTGLARLLPERDPHENLYELLTATLDTLDDVAQAGARVIRFELAMLAELGFGLDLERCVATGTTGDIAYVSPKSGGAVSREAGEPWRDRLLRLPSFLMPHDESAAHGVSREDIEAGFTLTGLFLTRHALELRREDYSDARAHFVAAVLRARVP
jgi:DNA repair protein RecO (recombination protein O)